VFEIGRLSELSALERLLYWASAVPAFVILALLFIIVAVLGVWGEREAGIERWE
jgi:hypothetical protein